MNIKDFDSVDFMEVKPIDLSRDLTRHPTKRYKVRSDTSSIKRIVVHTTDRDWSIDQLVEYDVVGELTYTDQHGTWTEKNRISEGGLPAITYHDIIMRDGSIYHTLPYREISWHAGGYNSLSIAIALMFRCTDSTTNKDTYSPTDLMIKTLQCHCGDLCLKLGLPSSAVIGHRELKGTGWFLNKSGSKRLRKTCPGMALDLSVLRSNITTYMQIRLAMQDCYTGNIDGIYGPRTAAALRRYSRNEQ